MQILQSYFKLTLFGFLVASPVPAAGQSYSPYGQSHLQSYYNGWTPWQNYFNYYLQRYSQSKPISQYVFLQIVKPKSPNP